MADSDSGYHGWQNDDGSGVFVADGQKRPVLVYISDGGDNELVLADFTSAEAASVFQDWIDHSFEETALANQRLSAQLQGMDIVARPSFRTDVRARIPGVQEEDDDDG